MTHSITLIKSQINSCGGAEKYARYLANAFYKKGCSLRVITTGLIPEDVPCEVVTTKLKSKTSFAKVREFADICKKELENHPTPIVFSLERLPFQTHLRASNGVHKAYLNHRKNFESPLLFFRHAINPLHRTHLRFEKQGFSHSGLQKIFTNSQMVKEEILTYYDLPPSSVSVIHNGVEWAKYKQPFAEGFALPQEARFHFLFIGHGFARKGLAPLLKGLAQLPTKDWKLSIIGKDKNENTFKLLAHNLKIGDRVTFCGPHPEIIPFLQRADCLVIPSYYDPFANVTVEALAMGLYVVSSTTNGGAEILTEQTGTVIENLASPDAVSAALNIALDRPKTKQRAETIRASVESLDFATQLDKYLEETLC